MEYLDDKYGVESGIRNYSNLAVFDSQSQPRVIINNSILNRITKKINGMNPIMITRPQTVYDLLRDIGKCDRESFYCLHLNTRHRLIFCEEVSRGTLDASLVHPREVFKSAILQSASGIILSHNHPSGDPTPSADDIEITSRLDKVGELVGISVLDHIIIGSDSYLSMKEEGLV